MEQAELAALELINVKPSVQTAMAIALLASLWAIIRSLTKRSDARDSPFSWDELLCEFGPDGQLHPSILRCVYAGSFVFSMWLMVLLANLGHMEPTYMLIFNASWVLPLAFYLIWGKKFSPDAIQKLVEALRGQVISVHSAPPAPPATPTPPPDPAAPGDDGVRRP